ncbi:DinB family protein [Paenibacillus sp. DYY-L-2]|uniref:DinB family protein n=1 Tax=Paenibacillus sp. DYY-L-2 TaxID=3447013 RepID=UPI003F502708
MDHYIFKQLRFVRDNTLKHVTGISDEKLNQVPQGLNNNILWNLGHILFVHERFSFGFIQEKMEIPDHFVELFGQGTKPATWGEQAYVPSLDQLISLLGEQIDRIERKLGSRLDEKLEKPYVTSAGLEILTVKECLSFLLYHEGMHFAVIKAIKQM